MASNAILIQGLIELHLKGEGGQQAVASMTKIIAQAKEVEKATGGFGTGAEKAAKGIGTLEASFASLGRTVAGYFAAGVVANFLKDSYIGFARTERQALAVENQIKSLGQAADGAGFRGFIAQLSQTSGILDDDLVPAMQRAIGAFKSYATAQEIVTLASKFAAAGIGDVGSNVDAIARFFQTGMARGLTQFGINIKGATDGTLGLTEGLKELYAAANRVGGGFADAQSQINAMGIVLDSLKDSVGKSMSAIGEKVLIATNYWREFIINATAGMDLAEGQAQDVLNAKIGKTPAVFGPQATAAQLQFAREAASRAEADEKKKAETALQIEKDRIAKVKDIEEKASQDLLKSRIDSEAKGTRSRLDLELQLNAELEAAAIASATAIGAKTLDIAKFFAAERGRIRASQSEDPETRTARETAAAFDPRAGFEEVEKFYDEHEKKLTEIHLKEVDERQKADAATADFKRILAESERQQNLSTSRAAVGALGALFAKNKAFAIGMAIINTALGITEVWTDKSLTSWYAKVAATIVVAASGAAQLAAIQSASQGSGGGGSAGVASAPTVSATPPASFVAPQSQAQVNQLAGRSAPSGAGGTTINIGTAFGDRQSMTKLSRELDRIARNDQSALR